MSSRFLSDGDTDLSVLQEGTFIMNVAGVTVGDAVPGLPLRSDGRRKVTSGLIQLADCAFTPIASPATTALDMNGHNTRFRLIEVSFVSQVFFSML